jgi:hypothetical protein
MPRDLLRQVVTVVAFIATVTVNGMANALPLNGVRTGEISDRFEVLVIPAGYVFAIWGLIYLGQLAFTVFQALPSRRDDPLLRRLGYLPATAAVLNAGWIVLWHWEAFAATLIVMLGLLVTLLAIGARTRAGGEAETGVARWAVRIPFSVYTGWITVATVTNIAAVLSWAGFTGLGIAPELWAVAVLLVGLAIAGAATWLTREAAYGLVIVWAYAGIAVKEADVAPVALVGAAGAAAMLGVAIAAAVRHPAGHRPATPPPAPAPAAPDAA